MIPPVLVRRLMSDVPFLSDGGMVSILTHTDSDSIIQAAEHPVLQRIRDELRPQVTRVGSLAILPISSVLARRPHPIEMLWYGFEDTEGVRGSLEELGRDDEVTGILLDVDSPGGFLTGGPEVADTVARINATKPVVTWSGGMMASLAYWIGSQSREVIASRSATVGSIGVFASLLDVSKRYEEAGIKVELFRNSEATFKAAGLPGTSLSEAQREQFQKSIQATFVEFRSSVLAARSGIPDDAMRGQTFTGKQGREVGMVDRIGDRDFALSVLKSHVRRSAG